MTVSGELRIVPTANLGDLGPDEGDEVTYSWIWYYHLPNLLLWLVLIAALIFVKGNHNPQALLILIPFIIVNILWIIFKKVMSMPLAESYLYYMVFNSFTVGIAVLWLLGHILGKLNGIVVFLTALAIMIVIGILCLISYGCVEFSNQTIGVIALQAILILSLLPGFALTRWRCRKRYGNIRFMLNLGFWIMIFCFINVIVTFFVVSTFQNSSVSIGTILPMLLISGLVIGVFVNVAVFPFMILAIRNPFFRERFYTLLRIETIPTNQNDSNIDAETKRNAIEDCRSV